MRPSSYIKLAIGAFFVLFFSASFAHAALYNASGLVGQVDQNGNPVYTTKLFNNAPNASGVNSPYGVLVDAVNHRLFVTDAGNNRVMVFNLDITNNIASTSASYVLGQPDFASSGATTTRTGLSNPRGLALDPVANRLFVSDRTNNRVMVFDAATSTIQSGEPALNVIGQGNFTSKVASTSQTGISGPNDVAYDPASGRLFIVEADNARVTVFDAATSTIQNGGTALNVLGQPNFTITNHTTTQSGIWSAGNITLDAATSRLFVGDSTNSRVMVFGVATSTIQNGEVALNVLGQNDFTSKVFTSTQSSILGGVGLAFDAATNRLFATDSSNNRIMVFDAATSTIQNGELAQKVLGQSNFTSSTSGTAQNLFWTPLGIAFGPVSNRLFAVDQVNQRIMVFDVATSTIQNGENASGLYGHIDQNGNPVYTILTQNNTLNAQGLSGPRATALDTVNHRMFVSDTSNSRVLVFNLDASNNIAATSASYFLGQSSSVSGGATTTSSGLNQPRGLVYDATTTRLFVADYGNHRVMVFNVDPAVIANGEVALNVLGQSNFTSSTATTTTSGLSNPYYLALDPATNRLFVADYGNLRVMVFDVATSTIQNGEAALNELGQVNFTSKLSTTTQTSTANPLGLAFDPATNRLFVGEFTNVRITVFDVATATIQNGEAALNVLGQTLYTTKGVTTTQSGISNPYGIAFDPGTNRLFAADYNNHRIMVFDVATSTIQNGEAALNVLGQDNFASSTFTTTRNSLNNPIGITFDPSANRLFIVDATNQRIIQYSFVNITTASLPSGTNGSAYSQTIIATSSQGTLTFALQSGSLPSGLALATTTGVISGTPSSDGTYPFTIEADDTLSTGNLSRRVAYSLVIASNSPSPSPGKYYIAPNGTSTNAGTSSTAPLGTIADLIALPSVVVPQGAATATTQITFAYEIQLTPAGGTTITIPSSTIMTTVASSDFTQLAATTTVATTSFPSGYITVGAVQFGLAATSITLSQPVTITITVDSQYEGKTLAVYRAEPGGSSWAQIGSCVVTGAVCTFTTSNLSSFVVALASAPVAGAPADSGASVSVAAGGVSASTLHPSAGTSAAVSSSTAIANSSSSMLAALLAQLDSLKAQLAALEAQTGFSRNLLLGSTGDDVMQLQNFLISRASGPAAAKLAAHGTTRTFGPLTLRALIELQKRAGIAPAAGYFGAKTRAYANAAQGSDGQ